MDFRVMSDSSCDISQEQEKRYDIQLISYYVSFDGVNYKKDRKEISAEDFYREMAENPGVYPKTSMPTQVDFYEAFLPYAQKGENIIYLNLTSKFSSSFMSANLAAEGLMEEYPDCKIAVIDSFSATVQEGLLVTEAAKMAEAGFSFEEAVEKLEELKLTSRIFFTTGDLSYLQKGGRIGKVLTQAASMLKIKPIIHLYEGELQAAGIARARKKSIAKFMEDARAFFADKNINDYRICTGKGHDKEEYDAFHKEVQEEMKALGFTGEVESYQIGCTIGVHTGPTPIGIACIRKFDA
ncbi:MAG: DegV family protein [Anaerotignum sp.]|nr:DegV family protein [Anaerotignum sp.]MBQ7102425.1 DegV family protein [Anaerotignum sp.]